MNRAGKCLAGRAYILRPLIPLLIQNLFVVSVRVEAVFLQEVAPYTVRVLCQYLVVIEPVDREVELLAVDLIHLGYIDVRHFRLVNPRIAHKETEHILELVYSLVQLLYQFYIFSHLFVPDSRNF